MTLRLRRFLPAMAALVLVFGGAVHGPDARAHSYKMGDLAVGHIWAPVPKAGDTDLSVYGPILNRGQSVARLVGVSTTVAAKADIRIDKDGKTRTLEALDLPSDVESAKGVQLAELGYQSWQERRWIDIPDLEL